MPWILTIYGQLIGGGHRLWVSSERPDARQIHQLAMELVERALGIRILRHRIRILHCARSLTKDFIGKPFDLADP